MKSSASEPGLKLGYISSIYNLFKNFGSIIKAKVTILLQ